MGESAIEKRTVRLAGERGWESYKWVSPARRGVPDRIFLSTGGVVVFMEFKAPGAKPTVQQERTLRHLRAMGHHATWVDNVQAALDFLDAAMEPKKLPT